MKLLQINFIRLIHISLELTDDAAQFTVGMDKAPASGSYVKKHGRVVFCQRG